MIKTSIYAIWLFHSAKGADYLLLVSNSDTFNFHLCADSESVGAERAPGRIGLIKPGFVDLVERCPLGYIRQHDQALDDVVHGNSRALPGSF